MTETTITLDICKTCLMVANGCDDDGFGSVEALEAFANGATVDVVGDYTFKYWGCDVCDNGGNNVVEANVTYWD